MRTGNIYLIKSRDRQVLGDTFMRFQEYYESPVFNGKTFAVEDFTSWYRLNFGDFTYSEDWSGFNIPSSVLSPFMRGDFDPLTLNERRLLEIFKNIRGNYYVIGACDKDDLCIDTLKHEFAHASFNNSKEYRAEVVSCIDGSNTKSIRRALIDMGYHSKVMIDEINAYMLTEPETMEDVYPLCAGEKLQNILDKIFYKYFGYSLYDAEPTSILNRISTIKI